MFVNDQINRDLLPEFDQVELHRLDARYAPVVLGCVLVVLVPAAIFVTFLFFAVVIPETELPFAAGLALYGLVELILALVTWYSYKAASLIRYAVRQHDVIVRKGVFWKQETIQPIKRIQHVEQHQGPVDKRFGLYTLKLFSAGTGHFTFEIPGLDAEMAAGIKQHVLTVKQQDWGEAVGGEAITDEAVTGEALGGKTVTDDTLPDDAIDD